MNILILTIGTQGDVQPYVALGKGLKAAGHEVTICTCVKFEPFVVKHGLRYAYMNNDIVDLLYSAEGRLAMDTLGSLWKMIKVARKLLPKLRPMQRRQIGDAWKSTQASSPDLILYHPKMIGAVDFADRLNVPCMLAFYLPMYAPSGEVPAMLLPRLPLGGWYNRLSYRFIAKATWWGTGKQINKWRDANGLSPRRAGDYLQRTSGEQIPAMHAYSPSVVPQPTDWPATAAVTGYWFLDQTEEWQPSAELEDFLNRGRPPVYFGFGSIFGADPATVTRKVVEAIRETGERGIIARGWGGLDPAAVNLGSDVFAIDSAPHDWLFPRVSAVVHHGGCGTTAAGLRAGRPTIICPFFGDQPFWGARVEALGVGPAPIPQRKLTVARLSAAIRQVTTDLAMKKRADALGEQIRSEDGVANAVAFIHQQMNS